MNDTLVMVRGFGFRLQVFLSTIIFAMSTTYRFLWAQNSLVSCHIKKTNVKTYVRFCWFGGKLTSRTIAESTQSPSFQGRGLCQTDLDHVSCGQSSCREGACLECIGVYGDGEAGDSYTTSQEAA